MIKIFDNGLGEYRLGNWSIKVQLGSQADADIIRVAQEHGARIIGSGTIISAHRSRWWSFFPLIRGTQGGCQFGQFLKTPLTPLIRGETTTNSEHLRTKGPADGIYTDVSGGPIGISTADCMPLILVTADRALALHVSRKTLIAGQLDYVPKIFNVAAITGVFIGPHICPQHFIFEYMGPEILAFARRWPQAVTASASGMSLNLDAVVFDYLLQWAVSEKTISKVDVCTVETLELPSYCRSRKNQEKLEDSIITSVQYLRQSS